MMGLSVRMLVQIRSIKMVDQRRPREVFRMAADFLEVRLASESTPSFLGTLTHSHH